jgi:phage baseplate assembly protein V
LAPLRRGLATVVGRAIVQLVDDSLKTQNLQIVVRADEPREAVEHFQPAGFKSVPLPGAESVVLALGGNGDNRIAVVTHDKRHRPTDWEPGDVGLYHTVTGDLIWLRASGAIEVTASGDVSIKTGGKLTLDGDLFVSGDVHDGSTSMRQMRALYNQHSNPSNGSATPIPQMPD